MTDRLAEHIEDEVSEERLERLWQGIDARRDEFLPSSDRKGVVTLISGLAVAAGVTLGWFFGAPLHNDEAHTTRANDSAVAAPLEAGGAALRTGSEKMAVDLDDGSKVTLAPRSRLAMKETHSDDVTLSLQEGRVACDVAKDKGRSFSVMAAGVTVRVVGTRFSVERLPLDDGEKVAVVVDEGIVEVSGPDGVQKRLSAGESWSVKILSDVEKSAALQPTPADDSSAPVAAPKKRPSKASVKSGAEARDLFAEARAKRNAGNAAGAAKLYEDFLRKHGSDGRAGVAALELGRLKMDQLGDVAGAIAPLTQAASRGAGGLGDDALARLAQAYSRLGQTSACQRTRSRYMKSYPKGVHVQQVRSLCP
jgi:hypothetical protein